MSQLGALTPREHRVLLALLESKSTTETAEKSGVSARHVRRIVAKPGFKAALAETRRDLMRHATARLQAASVKAVESLEAALSAGEVFARIQAAQAILNFALRASELEDISERLEALEAQAARPAGGGFQ